MFGLPVWLRFDGECVVVQIGSLFVLKYDEIFN